MPSVGAVCSTLITYVRKTIFSRSTAPDYPPEPYGPSQTYPESPPWYREDEDIHKVLTPEARAFFARYSGLEELELENKIRDIVSLSLKTNQSILLRASQSTGIPFFVLFLLIFYSESLLGRKGIIPL